MQKIITALSLILCQQAFSQDVDTVSSTQPTTAKSKKVWIFSSPKLINANTVEMIPKGVLEFKVTHNFGDIAGDFGGVKNFFGLDNATDVRIGFQYGISSKLNLIAARAKGAGVLQQLYEVGAKYQIVHQTTDNKHPLSVTLFGNVVASAMKATPVPDQENSFKNFSSRLSEVFQLMLARQMGKLSVQVSPTFVSRNTVIPGDDKNIFALGAAVSFPFRRNMSLIVDYFHSFRSKEAIDANKAIGLNFHDALGVGFEITTGAHVFHLNFTNATETLENRFLTRTVSSWGKGEFRWGFTISRNFDLLAKKRNKNK